MNFNPVYNHTITPTKNSLCLLYEDENLWVLSASSLNLIPEYAHFPESIILNTCLHHLGELGKKQVFLMHGKTNAALPNFNLLDNFTKKPLRNLFTHVSEEYKILINLGYHIFQWEKNSQFCGHCGSIMHFMQNQRGKTCKQCTHNVYPLVMPCIIVAIIKDNSSILLAEINTENSRFQSVLAGFIEAGETLEEAVVREVKEEVGIKIKNLKYYGSQPWGFSQSLMIAFMAEYSAGDIQVDGHEIQHAKWYSTSELAELPPKYSIAREMIEAFRSKQ